MQRLSGAIGRIALAVLLSLGAVIGQSTASQEAEDGDGPVTTVQALHEALLAAMQQAGSLGFAGRRKQLAAVIGRSFDFTTISATVLGATQWKQLTAAQRSKMENTFRELTIATYADRFDNYSGEEFRVISQRSLRQGRALVRSELAVPDDEPVRLDYVLHRVNGEWRIVNILADGVSDLSVKRAEYSSILRTEGFDQLMVKLEEQIAELSAD